MKMKKNFSPFTDKTAFSLVEMSIVVIVIGILIAGVISGSAMINSARISSARSFTVKSVVPSIKGLVAWYETSLKDSLKVAESYDTAQISTWYDISPSSIVAQRNTLSRTAGSDLLYTSDGINNIPSLNFSSTANITLSSFYQSSSAQNTIFLVFSPLVSTITGTLLDSISSASTTSIGITSTTVALNAGSAVSTSTATNSASFAIGSNYIAAVYFNGSSSQAFVNNATTSAGSGTINPGSAALTGLTIGTNKSSSSAFTGLISEIIIYNRPLQLQERRDIFKYLSFKYGIAVTGI